MQIISYKIKEKTIEIVIRVPSGIAYLTNPPTPAPDRVYKEVYGIIDGKIKLIETIEGKHVPAFYQTEQIIF